MGEILFLAHRIPFPPDRGDKIRSHHVLNRLARIAPVHVAAFVDDDADAAEEVELALVARTYRLVRRTRPVALAGVQALLTGQPVSLTAFRDPAIAAFVAETLRTRRIRAIYVFSGQMAQYVPPDFAGRVIVDFVDVDSAKFEAYATSGMLPMRWINAREGRLLRAEESRIAARVHASLLVTPEEAALFTARLDPAAQAAATVRAVGNGIDTAVFNPAATAPAPELAGVAGPRLIFTGQMDYAPNVAAAVRAVTRIMPLIRRSVPGTTFHVVGRKPIAAVRALDGVNGCRVWGRVADIRPWLRGADLALIPLEIARGVQNKVLEAMAMALPVVATTAAATGIAAVHGRHFALADSDADLAQAVISLLNDRPRARAKGLAARRLVEETLGWPAVLAGLSGLVGPSIAPLAEPVGAVPHAA